jgi:hypothetical protein
LKKETEKSANETVSVEGWDWRFSGFKRALCWGSWGMRVEMGWKSIEEDRGV